MQLRTTLRAYQANPIYQREQGRWGEPNPYFSRINRNAPLIVLLVIVLGVCCGSNTFSSFFGVSDLAGGLLALACLPNVLVQMITWAGIILAPTLTAPAVVDEVKRGSWDFLRLTPFSTGQVLTAKLLGGLSRLKIWIPLLVLNGIQAVVGLAAAAALAAGGSVTGALLSLAGIVLLIARPWIEIAFAALVGLLLSSITRSTRGALAGSYAVVLLVKMVNSSIFWLPLGLTAVVLPELESSLLGLVAGGPTLIYVAMLIAVLIALRVQAGRLEQGLAPVDVV